MTARAPTSTAPCDETLVRVQSNAPSPPRRVESVPRFPSLGASFEIRSPNGHPSYTHYLFRFPAKFHPPIVSWALETYGRAGMSVLDPFAGSGTVQVEALVRGLDSVGIDIDPLACFLTRAKTTPIPPADLVAALKRIECLVSGWRRTEAEIARLTAVDLSEEQFAEQIGDLAYPSIPNLSHWFRRYVVVDLARLVAIVEEARFAPDVDTFFRACVASVIRRVSNADPYPVSALEVSRVQASRNRERKIDVFGEFLSRAPRHVAGMASMYRAWSHQPRAARATALRGNTMQAGDVLRSAGIDGGFPLAVTSPPYCTAVNYSRRHKLEMYWLGFVSGREEHIRLAHSYLGRRWVRVKDWDDCPDFGIGALDATLAEVAERKRARGRALRHYFWSMAEAFNQIGSVMAPGGTLICATGDSVSCGTQVETTRFLSELASDAFALRNHFSYVLRNRYMQYPLRNGRGIRHEHILVFERRRS